MNWIVGIFIFLFNTFDGIATHIAVSNGKAIEYNPLINLVMNTIGVWFLLPKILIGFIMAILIIIAWKKFILARAGGITVLIIYFLLVIYHIIGIVF